jgi:hypothetical protein
VQTGEQARAGGVLFRESSEIFVEMFVDGDVGNTDRGASARLARQRVRMLQLQRVRSPPSIVDPKVRA